MTLKVETATLPAPLPGAPDPMVLGLLALNEKDSMPIHTPDKRSRSTHRGSALLPLIWKEGVE